MIQRSIACLAILAFATAAGCGLADAEPRTLSMSVEATPLVLPVGDRVTARTDATGQSLLWTILEWGDGFADSIGTVGFEQKVSATHTYTIPGSHTIRATAVDVLLGEIFDEITVEVQGTASNE